MTIPLLVTLSVLDHPILMQDTQECSFWSSVSSPSSKTTTVCIVCVSLTFLLQIGLYPISTLVVAWVGTNMSPDSKRAFALPYFYSIGNLSTLVSSQLYPTQDGPRYIMGNSISAGLEAIAACLYITSWLVLRRRNIQKKKLREEGATTNGMEDDRGLFFTYGL